MPVDHVDNTMRRFSNQPATGPKKRFLQGAVDEMLREPQVAELIETVRSDFEIEPPSNDDELEFNSRVDRQAVRRRVHALASETTWKGEFLDLLNVVFGPDDAADELIDAIDQGARTRRVCCRNASQIRGQLIRGDRTAKRIIRQLRDWYLASEFCDLLVDIVVDTITDRIIRGTIVLPDPLPDWFAYNVVPIATRYGPVLLAYVGPFADIHQVTKDLTCEYHRLYRPGTRERLSPEADRNTWLRLQYDTLIDEPAIAGESIIDRLLSAYESGPYREHLHRYDLDTAAGQKSAKSHIRDVLRKERDRARAFLDHLGVDLDEPSGG